MIEPYEFVRAVTIALGVTWALTATVRTVRFARRWERRLEPFGFERRWCRRQIARACLRVIVLDPVNLLLTCVLAASWSLRGLE